MSTDVQTPFLGTPFVPLTDIGVAWIRPLSMLLPFAAALAAAVFAAYALADSMQLMMHTHGSDVDVHDICNRGGGTDLLPHLRRGGARPRPLPPCAIHVRRELQAPATDPSVRFISCPSQPPASQPRQATKAGNQNRHPRQATEAGNRGRQQRRKRPTKAGNHYNTNTTIPVAFQAAFHEVEGGIEPLSALQTMWCLGSPRNHEKVRHSSEGHTITSAVVYPSLVVTGTATPTAPATATATPTPTLTPTHNHCHYHYHYH